MSGGDFLFIFSFIILPTAILVSAVWALIAIRAGVLLPPRGIVDQEYDYEYDVLDGPEDKAAHAEGMTATADRKRPIAASPHGDDSTIAASCVDVDQSIAPQASAETAAPSVDPQLSADEPTAEQTMEMDAVAEHEEMAAEAPEPEHGEAAQPVSERSADDGVHSPSTDAIAATAEVPSQSSEPAPPARTASVPDDLDIVFVPRDETEAPPASTTDEDWPHPDLTEPMAVERIEEAQLDASLGGDDELAAITPDEAPDVQTENEDDVTEPNRHSSRRRGARNAARLRPTDEAQARPRLLVASPPRRGNRVAQQTDPRSVSEDERTV